MLLFKPFLAGVDQVGEQQYAERKMHQSVVVVARVMKESRINQPQRNS